MAWTGGAHHCDVERLPQKTAMRSAIEALLLMTALTAISMAMIALFDLVTGPMSWWRTAGWFLVVLSLPQVGPILYYRLGAE